MATTRISLRAATMMFVIFALFASACGGSGSEDAASDVVAAATDESNDEEAADEGTNEDSGDADGSDSSDSGSGGSPLDEFLGIPSFDPGDPEASQAQFAEQERAREEAVAACMRAEGFEYTPQDNSQFSFFGDEDGEAWGTEEWVKKWGYGITTQSFSQSEVGPDLLGYDDQGFPGSDDFEPEDDPNYVYQNSLSEAEREAYEEALYGEQPDIDFEALTDEEIDAAFQDFEFSGCQNQSFESEAGNQQAFYQEFGDEIEAMYEAMENDPRVLEVQAEVEACVTEKGVEFVSEEDAYEQWEEKLGPIRERMYSQFEDDPLDEASAATMSDEEIQEFYENLPRPEMTDEDKVVLGEMQQEEIAIAIASFECDGGYSNQIELFEDLRVEYEQRFLEENGAALEAFTAAN